MKYLIFGGTGFVGRNLVRYIEAQGGEVLSVSRSGGAKTLALDITKESEFARINFLPDVIINCASTLPQKDKASKDPGFLKELFMTNVVGSVNIVNWAVKKQIPKLINCSTLVVVKKPWPAPLTEEYSVLPEGFHVGYSMSKLSQEQIMNHCVEESETKLLHLRLSAVYGAGMAPGGIIFKILNLAKQHKEIVLTDGRKNTLDLINVQDVCKAIFEISRNKLDSEENVLNLANGEEVSIYELAEIIKIITSSKSEIRDIVTNKEPSSANISVDKLKKYIDGVYDDFTPLELGLESIVKENS